MTTVKFGFSAEKSSDDDTKASIKTLKEWLLQNEDLPDLIDEQILHFLTRADNDLVKAEDVIKSCYRSKAKASYMFTNRDVEKDLKIFMERIEICTMPLVTEDGCGIVYTRLVDTDYRNVSLENYFKVFFMTIDSLLYQQPLAGIIAIFDLDGTSFMHMTKVKPSVLKHFLTYFQEGLPLKLKATHCLNTASFINVVMKMAKPFLKNEFLERTHFHSRDMDLEEFHSNHLEKRYLPENLGGDLPSTKELHRRNVQTLTELSEHFAAEEAQRKR